MSTLYQDLMACRRDMDENGLSQSNAEKVANLAVQECFDKDALTKSCELAGIMFRGEGEMQPVPQDLGHNVLENWTWGLLKTATMKTCSDKLHSRRAGIGVRGQFWVAFNSYLGSQLKIKKWIVASYHPGIVSSCPKTSVTKLKSNSPMILPSERL